jgi:hypothetical protein
MRLMFFRYPGLCVSCAILWISSGLILGISHLDTSALHFAVGGAATGLLVLTIAVLAVVGDDIYK